MKIFIKTVIILVLVFAIHITLYALNSYAAVPHLINYQGRLTDTSGKPLEGAYDITFKIYDAETGLGGMIPWEEKHQGVIIQKGIFSILLGSITDLDLAFDKPYFLEIKVGSEVMSPRQRLTASGYALRTEEAERLGGKQPSDYVLATEITSAPIANKAVKLDGSSKIPYGNSILGNVVKIWHVEANTQYVKSSSNWENLISVSINCSGGKLLVIFNAGAFAEGDWGAYRVRAAIGNSYSNGRLNKAIQSCTLPSASYTWYFNSVPAGNYTAAIQWSVSSGRVTSSGYDAANNYYSITVIELAN